MKRVHHIRGGRGCEALTVFHVLDRVRDDLDSDVERLESAEQLTVLENLALVWFVARRIRRPRGFTRMDAFQSGCIGLIEAVKSHDPAKARLSTFAVLCIRHRIWLWADLWESGKSAGRRRERNAFLSRMVSTEAVVHEDAHGRTLLRDLIADERHPDPAEAIERRDQEAWLAAQVASMDGRLADILRRRMSGETLESIGDDYGVTRERIRQLEERAIAKLRWLSTRSMEARFAG